MAPRNMCRSMPVYRPRECGTGACSTYTHIQRIHAHIHAPTKAPYACAHTQQCIHKSKTSAHTWHHTPIPTHACTHTQKKCCHEQMPHRQRAPMTEPITRPNHKQDKTRPGEGHQRRRHPRQPRWKQAARSLPLGLLSGGGGLKYLLQPLQVLVVLHAEFQVVWGVVVVGTVPRHMGAKGTEKKNGRWRRAEGKTRVTLRCL